MSAPGDRQHVGEASRADWRTPQWLFAHFHERHNFQIDAAADSQSALCTEYFGLDNGPSALARTWAPARYWLNPPYGRASGDMLDWIEYILGQINAWGQEHARMAAGGDFNSNRYTLPGVGFLVPVAAGTRWWRTMAEHAQRTSLLGPSRVPFINPDTGQEVKGNPSDSSFAWITKRSMMLKNGQIVTEDVTEMVRRARKAKTV